MLAINVTWQAIGEDRYKALPDSLFGPSGMSHTVAETYWHGNYVISSQVWPIARNLTKPGLF